jgi:hypothetical protein
VLKKKTLAIVAVIVFVLSLGVTAYILWRVRSNEDVTPEEGEAGLGLTVGEYGCREDDDCVGQYVHCDEVMSHDPDEQRCEYYKCPSGYELSSDKLSCDPITATELSCGDDGCEEDNDCVDDNNICTNGICVLGSCPDGYEMSSDKCSCTEIEPECGDGEFNLSGEECEYGDPTGYQCTWSECNKSTCTCPVAATAEESSTTTTSQEEDTTTEELPETGISDLPDEIMTFYAVFFASGGILILSYIFESPKKKWQNSIMDRLEK